MRERVEALLANVVAAHADAPNHPEWTVRDALYYVRRRLEGILGAQSLDDSDLAERVAALLSWVDPLSLPTEVRARYYELNPSAVIEATSHD
jgi:hypothetical protein